MEIIKFIQSFSSPFWDWFFQLVTMLGEEYFFILVMSITLWCISKEFGYRLGLAYLTTRVLNAGLKIFFHTPRPIGQQGIRSIRLETAGGYGFPSGHTQANSAFWTSVMIKFKEKWLYFLGSLLIFLVAISRLYLGLHYPVDVIGGIVLGVIWVFISNNIFDYAVATGKNMIFLVIVIPMYLGLLFIDDVFYYKMTGTVTAFILGYIIESKYVKYQVRAALSLQVVKLLLGMAGLFFIRIISNIILPEKAISDLIRYFLMGFWVTILAPLMFKIVFQSKDERRKISL